MEPLSMIGLGIGLAATASGMARGFEQANEQRRETAEQVRRFSMIKRRQMSETEALGNASGITADSASLTKYMADMSAEFSKQADWMHRAGEVKASGTEYSAVMGAFKNMGSSMFGMGAQTGWGG